MRLQKAPALAVAVAAALIASATGADDREPPGSETPATEVIERIAEAYYAVPRGERREWTGPLSGQVVDRRGRGVSSARVVVKKPASSRVIGETTTDSAGRFRIPKAPKRGIVVTATADGFARWSMEGRLAMEGLTTVLSHR